MPIDSRLHQFFPCQHHFTWCHTGEGSNYINVMLLYAEVVNKRKMSNSVIGHHGFRNCRTYSYHLSSKVFCVIHSFLFRLYAMHKSTNTNQLFYAN